MQQPNLDKCPAHGLFERESRRIQREQAKTRGAQIKMGPLEENESHAVEQNSHHERQMGLFH